MASAYVPDVKPLIDAAVAAAMPQPATVAPPPVALNSDPGTAGASQGFARADHTHQSRLQARRIQVTPDGQGQYVYVFPLPYPAGVVPVVEVTAENVVGGATRVDASIVQGSTTNAQTTILLTKINQSIVTGILGAVLPIIAPQTAATWINIMSRAPS